MKNFDSMADGILIAFTCPYCDHKIQYKIGYLPTPDWGAETAADSENSDDEDIYCDECGHHYCADIFMNIYEGNVIVTDMENYTEIESVQVKELFAEEEDYDCEGEI